MVLELCLQLLAFTIWLLSVLTNTKCANRCAFFFGEIDKPAQGLLQRGRRKSVNIGICLDGVYVMDAKEKVSAGFDFTCLIHHMLPFSLFVGLLLTKFILLPPAGHDSCSTCCLACVSMSSLGTTATLKRMGTRTFCGWSLMEKKTALLSTSYWRFTQNK